MKICELKIANLRSIVDTGDIPVRSLFALVGENNAGKSNVLLAIRALLTGGAGGLKPPDFHDPSEQIVIKGTFNGLTESENKRWKKYLVGDSLILEKHIWLEVDEDSSSTKIKTEYHGYEAEPKEWYLSISKILEDKGARPKWAEIAKENGLPDYFFPDGKSNKTIYTKALEKYLLENEVEFNEPDLSKTQALGLQSNVIASLPSFYLLPAITDYSDEIDKRQKSSTFRRLMGELSERILKKDPRFVEIEQSLNRVHALLNSIDGGEGDERLESLGMIENQISGLLRQLMPSVNHVSLSVEVEEVKELFSGGVALRVDDGVNTDVLAKGHGLQRCIVFSLLKTLIDTERQEEGEEPENNAIILAVEEPELYIHPQLSKLFYDVMRAFVETDQIIYTTHSPVFIDAYEYKEIGIVSKATVEAGTKIITATGESFEDIDDAKVFKGLARFNPSVSELFFAKKVLIVEGPEDLIAVNAVLVDAGLITNRAEEIDWTVLVAGGKEAIPFLQRVLNEFSIPYAVLHDNDITEGMDENVVNTHQKTNDLIEELSNGNKVTKFPIKLEVSLGVHGHLKDQFRAHQYFGNPENLTQEVKDVILSSIQ